MQSMRANSVAPGPVGTTLVLNQRMFDLLGGHQGATLEGVAAGVRVGESPSGSYVETQDISHAVLFLASDESRYVTGVDLVVDAGVVNQLPGRPPKVSEELGRLRQQVAELELALEPAPQTG
jgi:NAD(P)-dependent dehydrogenase (short-subunit alcohol dehydrogenase family)